MSNKFRLLFLLLVVTIYIALFAGCQTPQPTLKQYSMGHDAAKDFIANQLAGYRMVIMLEGMNADERDQFFQGFLAAYDDSGQKEKGKRYTGTLREAVKGSTFQEAKRQGELHANKKTTDARIQSLIRRSLGISRSVALAWKAGYIEGFKEGLLNGRKPVDKTVDGLYRKADAMYEALRAATGL